MSRSRSAAAWVTSLAVPPAGNMSPTQSSVLGGSGRLSGWAETKTAVVRAGMVNTPAASSKVAAWTTGSASSASACRGCRANPLAPRMVTVCSTLLALKKTRMVSTRASRSGSGASDSAITMSPSWPVS